MKPTNEMATAMQDRMKRSAHVRKTYKAESDAHKSKTISADVQTSIDALRRCDVYPRVDYSDSEQVRKRAYQYMEACAESGTLPTMVGLASYGFGMSRQAMYDYLAKNDNETTRFIERIRDAFADLTIGAAYSNNANAVMAIFALKNMHGFRDSVQIEPVQAPNLLGDAPDMEALVRKYAAPLDMIEGESSYGA